MNEQSYRILQTAEYSEWVNQESPRSQVQINKRLSMIKFEGYFADHKSVSFYEKGELKDKIWELRWNEEDVFTMLIYQKEKFYCF